MAWHWPRSTPGPDAWVELSLEDLRLYRRRVAEEEEKVSYWRRLVHARIDVLEAEAHHERPLRLDELIRVLGDTGTGRTRTALVSVRAADDLPELPILADMWVTELDPNDTSAVSAAITRLRQAEVQLTDYRRALHERLDEATSELIARYRENPVSALVAFTAPHTGGGRSGAMRMSPSDDLEQIWADFRATKEASLRNRLVLQYAPLVKYVAGRLRTRMPDSVDPDDLVSDGVLGLMDAIERFEPARGLSFQTFAVPRIRGAIIDGMRSMDFVPRSVRDKLRTVQRAQVSLEERLGRVPEDVEVAREVGIPVQQLRDLSRQANSNHANLDDFDLADELLLGGRPPGRAGRRQRLADAGRRPARRARPGDHRALLLRGPHPGRDRPGARGDRVPGQPGAPPGDHDAAREARRPRLCLTAKLSGDFSVGFPGVGTGCRTPA